MKKIIVGIVLAMVLITPFAHAQEATSTATSTPVFHTPLTDEDKAWIHAEIETLVKQLIAILQQQLVDLQNQAVTQQQTIQNQGQQIVDQGQQIQTQQQQIATIASTTQALQSVGTTPATSTPTSTPVVYSIVCGLLHNSDGRWTRLSVPIVIPSMDASTTPEGVYMECEQNGRPL